MRLTEARIRDLSLKLAAWLASREDVEVLKGTDVLALEVATVIRNELLVEVELEKEVDAVIRSHQAQIDADVDVSLLRQKIKRQLAKKRGLVL